LEEALALQVSRGPWSPNHTTEISKASAFSLSLATANRKVTVLCSPRRDGPQCRSGLPQRLNTQGEERFTSHTSNQGPVSRIHKELEKQHHKTNDPVRNWGKRDGRTPEDIQGMVRTQKGLLSSA
jgi:hypothetical protein